MYSLEKKRERILGKHGLNIISRIDGISDVTVQSGAKVGRYASPEYLYREYLSTLENTRHRRPNPYTKPDLLRKTDKCRPEHIKNSHHKSDSNRKIRGKCYNCGEVGHMQSHCPKERLECTLCKKLGHSVEKCFRNKNNRPKSNEHKTLMCDTQGKTNMNGYYVDCSINGHLLKGFIDSGCEIVTVRESDAKLAGLSWVDSEVCLNGYGGGTSKVLGISKVNLKVDLFDSNVPVYVVPDLLQTMAILIGRSVLSNPEAITVVKNGSAWLFSTKIADIPEVDELPTKITLRAKQKVEIPPHHIGFVTCSTSDKFDGDIFVDKRQSFQPLKEYVIPNCVTSTNDATIPILNVSESTLTFGEGQVFARGIPCKEEDKDTQHGKRKPEETEPDCQKKTKEDKILSDVTIVPPTKQKPPNPLIPSCDSSTSQHIQ
nr:unnamed protein product [Callosobruchus analis]